jgi:hypothetical protein
MKFVGSFSRAAYPSRPGHERTDIRELVYQILKREKPCLRGQSHEIAVRLGLKYGVIGSVDDLDLSTRSPLATLPRNRSDAPREEGKP